MDRVHEWRRVAGRSRSVVSPQVAFPCVVDEDAQTPELPDRQALTGVERDGLRVGVVGDHLELLERTEGSRSDERKADRRDGRAGGRASA